MCSKCTGSSTEHKKKRPDADVEQPKESSRAMALDKQDDEAPQEATETDPIVEADPKPTEKEFEHETEEGQPEEPNNASAEEGIPPKPTRNGAAAVDMEPEPPNAGSP